MLVMREQGATEIGCQGWNYPDWVTGAAGSRRVFYPHGTRAADMLALYARLYGTVEVDSTFYAVPSKSTVDGWHKRTPDGFTFSLKLPQEITHQQEFGEGSLELLDVFCERVRRLKSKLAVVLVQLPPQFIGSPENAKRLREFLPRLPGDVRFAIEFRSGEWIEEATIELLTKHRVALALIEGHWIKRDLLWRFVSEMNVDFAYVRFMGARDLTAFDRVQRPQDANLEMWSEAITELSRRVKEAYVYFSNYYEGHAPESANKLKRMLGQAGIEVAELEDQPTLF